VDSVSYSIPAPTIDVSVLFVQSEKISKNIDICVILQIGLHFERKEVKGKSHNFYTRIYTLG